MGARRLKAGQYTKAGPQVYVHRCTHSLSVYVGIGNLFLVRVLATQKEMPGGPALGAASRGSSPLGAASFCSRLPTAWDPQSTSGPVEPAHGVSQSPLPTASRLP